MIVKKNLNEQIYESLRRDILDQKIRFGDKLVNRQLQEKFGVSSTPVRDAINRLYLDGLLDEISNVGARVISFDYKVALEVNEIVSMFTREAVALSTARVQVSEISVELAGFLEQQFKNVDNHNYFIYDKKFHNTLFNHCGNAHLIRLHNQYSALWELLVQFYYHDKGSTRAKALEQHENILAAFKSNDVALMQQRVQEHFQEAVRLLQTSFD